MALVTIGGGEVNSPMADQLKKRKVREWEYKMLSIGLMPRLVGAIALAIFMFEIGVSTPVQASEKRFPGSLCVHWGGPAPILFFSGISNAAATGVTHVDCPIVQEHVFLRSGGSVILNAEVVVIDQNPDEDIRCFLTSVEPSVTGSPPNTFQLQTSHSASTTPQRIQFNRQVMQSALAHWYLSCEIPPTSNGNPSSIWSYYINEED